MKTKYVDCQCNSSDHVVRFVYDDEDLWIEVQLNPAANIFKRIWLAFRYILGYTCRYGHWDCTLISNEDKEALIEFIKETRHLNTEL